jgi:hypothetical protein
VEVHSVKISPKSVERENDSESWKALLPNILSGSADHQLFDLSLSSAVSILGSKLPQPSRKAVRMTHHQGVLRIEELKAKQPDRLASLTV